MRYLFGLLAILFLFHAANGQLSNNTSLNQVFLASKGSWTLPVTHYRRVINEDTVKHLYGCFFKEGITFVTDSATEVKAVYNGTVVTYFVFGIDSEQAIITKCGDYFITYGM